MINQEEYEILKDLDDRLGWLAKDGDGDLVAYEKKPEKSTRFWFDNGRMVNLGIIFDVSRLFQFIQWEDEEPHSIAELIEEHERNQAYEIFNRQFESLYEKIKETEMKKDIEWLKEKIKKAQPDFVQGYEWTLKVISKDEMYDLIDQLDEPEVKQLERKIKELDSFNDELIRDNNQLRNELDNQEVLSQELPVVPMWFDEWWKDVTKGEGNLFHNIEQFYDELFSSGTSEMYGYICSPDNKKKLLNIIVNELEYEVEEEQKYYAKIKGHELVSDKEDVYWNVDREELFIDNIWHDYSGYKTTKLTKYDWSNLGINEDNADFVKAEGVE